MCLKSMKSLAARFAWTSGRSRWSRRRACRHRRSDASTTSGRAPPSCSARPCPPGAGRRPASAGRVGRRSRQPAPGPRENHRRQPLRPHAGSVLRRGLHRRGNWSSEPLRAEARELAEHRGERTQDPAVSAQPSARRHPPDQSMGRRRQRAAARHGLGELTMPAAN